MFCIKCGAQLPDGAGFCSSCGSSLNAPSMNEISAPSADYNVQMLQAQQMQAQQYQMQKNGIRQSEIDSLSRTYAHFNLKQSAFQEYDKVGERLNYYSRGARSALIVWGAIITVFSFLILLGGASLGVRYVKTFMVPFAIFFIPGVMMITGGILMKVNNKKKRRYYESEYIRLAQELNDHYNAYPQCPVGAEYANPKILEVIMGVLNSGRADTIKEAINLMIAEVNQAEMSLYLQNIEAYAKSTSNYSKASAIFAAASFFTK